MAQTVYDRQKGDLDAEAERMRKEAEGRRLGMIDAYKAAASPERRDGRAGAGRLDGGREQRWPGSPGSRAAASPTPCRPTSPRRRARSRRVGAAGTGFDARSQAAVEAYRGGVIPGEEFTRLGAVGNEYILRSADNLKEQGRATGYADESQTIAEINADRLKAIAAARRQPHHLRGHPAEGVHRGVDRQQVAQTESLVEQQKLKLAADKAVNDNRMAIAKLKQQYIIAKMNVTSKQELAAIDAIYKNNKLALDQVDVGLADQPAERFRRSLERLREPRRRARRRHQGAPRHGRRRRRRR